MDRGGFHGYARMSGTSMACPHVSGIVALCYASGVCTSNTTTEYSAIVEPSVEHVTNTEKYRYSNDPLTDVLPDKYYGYLAWARRWWAA
jgi:subtilisin family serine protease